MTHFPVSRTLPSAVLTRGIVYSRRGQKWNLHNRTLPGKKLLSKTYYFFMTKIDFQNLKSKKMEIPPRTHGEGLPSILTVKDFIGDFPPIKAGGIHPDDPWHRCPTLNDRNLERIKSTPEGGDRRHWPEHLINECHKTHSGHMDVYGRMSWDKPAPTLTTRCYSYSNGRFGHPDTNQHRAISVREASRLQTFPKDFVFKGSVVEASRQIGNAVPCEMAKQFGLAILQHYRRLKEF